MKKQLLRYVSGIIPVLALFSQVNAQIAKASLEMNLKETIFNSALSNPSVTTEANTASINGRALKDFTKSFKGANNVIWLPMKDGFIARFVESGVETKAYYDHKGRWTATIRTYKENKLPKDVRRIVKSNYFDYTINQVNEVKVGEITAYLVRIEDDETFKTIRVIDGEMDVYENYKKAHN